MAHTSIAASGPSGEPGRGPAARSCRRLRGSRASARRWRGPVAAARCQAIAHDAHEVVSGGVSAKAVALGLGGARGRDAQHFATDGHRSQSTSVLAGGGTYGGGGGGGGSGAGSPQPRRPASTAQGIRRWLSQRPSMPGLRTNDRGGQRGESAAHGAPYRRRRLPPPKKCGAIGQGLPPCRASDQAQVGVDGEGQSGRQRCVAGAEDEDRLQAGLDGGLTLGGDVAAKQDAPAAVPRPRRCGDSSRVALGADLGVVVASQLAGQVAEGAVAKDQLLRQATARRVNGDGAPLGDPATEGGWNIGEELAAQRAAFVPVAPDQAPRLEAGGLDVSRHLPADDGQDRFESDAQAASAGERSART